MTLSVSQFNTAKKLPSFSPPKKKKNLIMISGLVILAISTILVLFFGFRSHSGQVTTGDATAPTNMGTQTNVSVKPRGETLSDLSVLLTNETFKSLKSYIELPKVSVTTPIQKGRENPFLPY